MASKYRKSTDKRASSFRRKIGGKRKPGSSILVVTEGKNTEPIYFDALRRMFAAPTVELVPHGAGAGDPRVLTDKALKIRKERRRLARRKELDIGQLENFDELWIVFDTDVLTAKKLHEGMAYAKSKGVKIAYSEPCFEYWLLLHGIFTTAPMAKCADVIPHLKRVFGWTGYDKNQAESVKMILPLVRKDLVQLANDRSNAVRQHHESVGTAFPANPSTDVDLLIRAINAAVGSAHKFLKE